MVDCEVAWYGDAAFDIAFLLSHLFLKSAAARRRPMAGDGRVDLVGIAPRALPMKRAWGKTCWRQMSRGCCRC